MKTLLIFALALTTLFCGDREPVGEYNGKHSRKHFQGTSAGIRVYSGEKINPQILPLIDAGHNTVRDIAQGAPYNYTKMLEPSHYGVVLFPRSPLCQNPAFTVRADGQPLYPDGYDQHPIFDKDPRVGKVLVCAAGFVLGPTTNEVIIVNDLSIASLITQYELEHLIIYHNDRDYYIQTMNLHSHPLLVAQGAQLTDEVIKFVDSTTPTHIKLQGKDVCVFLTN